MRGLQCLGDAGWRGQGPRGLLASRSCLAPERLGLTGNRATGLVGGIALPRLARAASPGRIGPPASGPRPASKLEPLETPMVIGPASGGRVRFLVGQPSVNRGSI